MEQSVRSTCVAYRYVLCVATLAIFGVAREGFAQEMATSAIVIDYDLIAYQYWLSIPIWPKFMEAPSSTAWRGVDGEFAFAASRNA